MKKRELEERVRKLEAKTARLEAQTDKGYLRITDPNWFKPRAKREQR